MSTPYSEAQRALALEIVARNGGEITAVALDEIRAATGVANLPKSTVWRWLQRDATDKKAATPEARAQAARALDVMLEEAARKFVEHATQEHVLGDASAREAMTAAGIAIDKMRLLRGLPTEIIQILPDVIDAFGGPERASEAFHHLVERARAAKQNPEEAPLAEPGDAEGSPDV